MGGTMTPPPDVDELLEVALLLVGCGVGGNEVG